ncbi:MAG: Beta-galactosidase trimerization domain protein [Lentisphaerae bacterium ADurb.BinA184]|nr:MAG: Beta-galactosidase trimerization domain protein [Lentisphaerae bacterium ADurb.BinA184]
MRLGRRADPRISAGRTPGRPRRLLWAWAAVGVLGLPALAWEDSERAIQEWTTLSAAYETPHTAWAAPLAGGPLRILYFIGSPEEGMATRAREAVELRQRLASQIDAVYEINFYGANWFGGLAGVRRLSRLLDNRYDAFVFQGVTPGKIPNWPENPHTRFTEAVKAGAGVVIIGADVNPYKKEAADPLAGRTEIAADAAWLAGVPVTAAHELGRGRILELPAAPFIPYREGWEVEYDQWQEKLVRAVLWAARRQPAATLNIEAPTAIERARLPAAATVAWRGAGESLSVEARLRRWDGQAIALEGTTQVPPGKRVTFSVPKVRSGRYFLECFARSGREVAGWAVHEVTVTAEAGLGEIALSSGRRLPFAHVEGKDAAVQEARERDLGIFLPYFDAGERIQGEVRTSGPAAGLTVSLCDVSGRELMRREGAGFNFPVEPWMPMVLVVRASLRDGDGEVAAAAQYVRHRHDRRGRFNLILWGYPVQETLAPYAARQLRRMGVDVLYSRWSALSAAAFNLGWLPYTGGTISAKRAGEWHDPAFHRYWVNHTGRAASHGALAYSLGDEGDTAGIGTDERTAQVFRDYLRREYGTVKALNTSWETEFADFAEIAVPDGKQALPALAVAPLPNLARDFDRFAFSGYNFVQMARGAAEQMRAQRDPRAVVGFEGAGEFDRETDPEAVCRELGFWAPYGGHADELIRSVAPRDFMRSNWMGYHQTADGHLSRFYYCLCNGCDSIWYWMWTTMGAWQGFQHPDLAGGVPPVEEFLRDTAFVRDGLGDLLLRCEMEDDGIAILYSRASVFLGRQKTLEPYGAYKWTHMTWATLLHDLGLQYRYVTDRMLRSGEALPAGCRVLILPVTHGLSPAAAEAIREFVRGGGTVLADFRPGLFDHHARPLDPATGRGALDDLFGVRASLPVATSQAKETRIEGKLGERALAAFTNPGRETVVATGVAAAGATALGQAGGEPVCLVNRVGKGQAILLNFALWSVMNARSETPNLGGQANVEETPHAAGALFLDVLAAAGVEPAYRITPYKNNAKLRFLGNLEVTRWRNGDYEIVSLFRQTGLRDVNGAYAQVQLPEAFAAPPAHRFVYDIRHQATVGQQFPGWYWISDILPARAAFYVVMKTPCPAPRIEMPAEVGRGTAPRVRISLPGAGGLHAVKIRVAQPDGTPAEWLDQAVMAGAAPAEFALPMAFNDPPGTWTLTATDVFTRETEQVISFAVK